MLCVFTGSSPKRPKSDGEGKSKKYGQYTRFMRLACDDANALFVILDFSTKLNYLFRDARFFLMKSNNPENINLAKTKGW